MNEVEKNIRKKIIKDERPWGFFIQYAHNEICTVKIITVSSNQVLSKQKHQKRDELWVVLDDGLRAELDDKIIDLKAGDEIVVPRKTEHRLSSTGKIGRILEVSFGHFDEKDIERLDDVYGRK
jgi:mannose-6-phosphate isomerase